MRLCALMSRRGWAFFSSFSFSLMKLCFFSSMLCLSRSSKRCLVSSFFFLSAVLGFFSPESTFFFSAFSSFQSFMSLALSSNSLLSLASLSFCFLSTSSASSFSLDCSSLCFKSRSSLALLSSILSSWSRLFSRACFSISTGSGRIFFESLPIDLLRTTSLLTPKLTEFSTPSRTSATDDLWALSSLGAWAMRSFNVELSLTSCMILCFRFIVTASEFSLNLRFSKLGGRS
mmetsp:Transcript_19163/g.34993  ORF Transcript_19163/g.34993 Transcript_19163/m.34993 type:complete len:231 (+) Transcript_19163:570-1262(+)